VIFIYGIYKLIQKIRASLIKIKTKIVISAGLTIFLMIGPKFVFLPESLDSIISSASAAGTQQEQKVDKAEIQKLIKALGNKYSSMWQTAAETLVKIGLPAVEPLIKALGDDWGVRQSAAEALAKIGSPAVESLIKALGDEDEDVRKSAAEALGKIIDKAEDVDILIKLLEVDNSDMRRKAAEALAKIGPPAVEPLLKALGDENRYVRELAAETLGKIGDTRAVDPLIKALGDDWGVRIRIKLRN
jgi:HEAT repeat protein